VSEKVQHHLIGRYGGILFSSATQLRSTDQLSLCIRRVFASFEDFIDGENKYAGYIDLHVLRGGECNAFVIPLAGRCKVFLTLGMISAVLQASRISVAKSTLPVVTTKSAASTTVPDEFVWAFDSALPALGLRKSDIDDCNRDRDNLALSIAQAILDFILHHELMHISMGHVAYNWKIRADSGFLEFGNSGLSKEQSRIRASFEVAADAMAGVLGSQLIFAEQSPFEDIPASRDQKLILWAYGVSLMCRILWRLANQSPESLMENSLTLEDAEIHPNAMKRRFNIEAFIGVVGDSNTPSGQARNKMVRECFGRATSIEYAATERTPIHVPYDPERIIGFFRDQYRRERGGGDSAKSLWRRWLEPAPKPTLMKDPGTWIADINNVAKLIQPTVSEAEGDFVRSFLRK
jgi:hypothetical protein